MVLPSYQPLAFIDYYGSYSVLTAAERSSAACRAAPSSAIIQSPPFDREEERYRPRGLFLFLFLPRRYAEPLSDSFDTDCHGVKRRFRVIDYWPMTLGDFYVILARKIKKSAAGGRDARWRCSGFEPANILAAIIISMRRSAVMAI